MREITATRSVLLELQEERRSLSEGYQFLDEKRMVLAGAILDELQRYRPAIGRFHTTFAAAVAALQGAVGRHGVEGLLVYPAESLAGSELDVTTRSVLGVAVQEAKLAGEPVEPLPGPNPSPVCWTPAPTPVLIPSGL